MFNFIVVLKQPEMNFTLSFKTEDMAKAARERVRDGFKKNAERLTIKDDYGHELDVFPDNISAILIQDGELVSERNQDQEIDKARAQATFLKRRESDMELMRLFPGNQIGHPAGRA